MAGVALPTGKRHMGELRHQLLAGRLVRIVAGQAIRLFERLSLVRLDDGRIFGIVAIECRAPERPWSGDSQTRACRALRSCGLCDMCRSPYPGRRDGCRLSGRRDPLVTAQTEIRILCVSALGLEQLVLVIGGVRIVALHTVAHRRRMDFPFDFSSFLFGVAGDAKGYSGGGKELGAGNILLTRSRGSLYSPWQSRNGPTCLSFCPHGIGRRSRDPAWDHRGTGWIPAQAAVENALASTMIEIALRAPFTPASGIAVCNCVAVA